MEMARCGFRALERTGPACPRVVTLGKTRCIDHLFSCARCGYGRFRAQQHGPNGHTWESPDGDRLEG